MHSSSRILGCDFPCRSVVSHFRLCRSEMPQFADGSLLIVRFYIRRVFIRAYPILLQHLVIDLLSTSSRIYISLRCYRFCELFTRTGSLLAISLTLSIDPVHTCSFWYVSWISCHRYLADNPPGFAIGLWFEFIYCVSFLNVSAVFSVEVWAAIVMRQFA